MSQSSPSSPSGSPSQQFETAAIHVGHDWRDQTGAVIPPVYLTSTFEYGNEGGFDYTRSGNPNFRNLQQTLAALEGCRHACVFASGVSAITAVVSTLKSGDVVVLEENKTKLNELDKALNLLPKELVVGFVINKAYYSRDKGYGYGYGYYAE